MAAVLAVRARTAGVQSVARQLSTCRPIAPPLARPSRLPTPQQVHDSNVPLLLPGLSSEHGYPWAAVRAWSQRDTNGHETLHGMRNSRTADLLVDVEIGRKGHGYMDTQEQGQWDKIRMPFDTFLDAFIARTIPSSGEASELVGYVAQQDLIPSVPAWDSALQPPLPHSRSGARGDKGHWMRNIWIGPQDTFTPIHRDPYHNLFVQVIGSKRIHLFPPSASPHLHLSTTGTQQNTSLVPTEDELFTSHSERFPGLHKALSDQHTSHAILHPGDALYIPKGWFHCVRSLETSVSVNDWWL